VAKYREVLGEQHPARAASCARSGRNSM